MTLSITFITFFLCIILNIYFQKLFFKKGIVDKINKRSSHKESATRSGGVALFITLFTISVYNYIIGNTLFDYSVIVPLGLLSVVGLYDDLFNIDFKLKFIFQIIAAKIIIDNGFLIENLHGIFGIYELNRTLAQLLTIFVILSIINAINFIDGIDGLAITIVAIFISLFELYSNKPSPFINLTSIILSSIIPLFYFNFKKSKKVFLGDSGSLVLGGIASIYIIYILTNDYVIIKDYDLHKLLFVISIFIYPIVDITRVVIIRMYNGNSPFEADKNHIHHKLNKRLKSHKKTTIFLGLFSLLFMIAIQLLSDLF